ncbi:MAG: DNA-3-methyladenine glycosylase I [Gammaproteobacteria bacterium]|nr:DNA-3-methyladenine glycosylase I [Gammaproteobacteria bacterium]
MEKFSRINARAAKYKGGKDKLEALLPKALTPARLTRIPDDRYLAQMAKSIFQSGFVWRIVENKWNDIETAFKRFNPLAIAHLSDEQVEKLTNDKRVIRHYKKILAIRHNATFILQITAEHGGFGKFISTWPEDDIVGLFEFLKKHGQRLGGNTGQFFLRHVGKDTFILTNDVVSALIIQGVVAKRPSSKSELKSVQRAFNQWREESGRNLCEISRILACSLGE